MSNLTLRKKRKDRPNISGPQPTLPSNPKPAPQQQKSGNSLAPPRERNAPTETSDLVKRRYSTRYNQLPDFSNLDTPAVPSLPGALKRASRGGSPKRPSRQSAGHLIQVDQSALDDPDLQHDRYVQKLLSNASAQEIQEYQNNLRRIKNRTSTNLQQSVYQNRTQFIRISKEAEKLKSEMQVLRGLMADLTTALAQTNSSSSSTTNGTLSPSPSTRLNARRTSVANLESMWNVQLQQLWRQVEKSQKFLPAIPGRHIIMENGSWVELDSATWKPKRPVHLFLLNDHLLIASKKRKRMDPNNPSAGPAPTKLVAEECFPLQDTDMVDMSTAVSTTTPSEERAIATAVTIRAAGRSLTYRSEKRDPKVKTELMQTFRKAVEDLRKQNLTPSASAAKSSAQQDSLNYFASRDPVSAGNASFLDSLSSSNPSEVKPDILIEVDGKSHNFRWLESQIDELDIDIALHHFEESASKVERLRKIANSPSLKSNSIARELVTVKIDERASKLATTLIRDMSETPSYLEATKSKVALLTNLGFEDRAREAYLSARTKSLVERTRQCVFEGDLHRFVFSLSYVYFTMIKNTIVIYQASFGSTSSQQGGSSSSSTTTSSMSAVISWANNHLEIFNGILQRQMAAVEKGGKVWRDCMDLVWDGEKTLREGEGLDFRSIVGRGLEDGPATRDNGVAVGEAKSREQSRSKSRARTPNKTATAATGEKS